MGGISFLDNHLQRRAGRMLSVFIQNHHSLLLCIWNLRLWGDIGDDDICYSKQYIRVNGGWRETDFWDVCTTQHFLFCPDNRAKHLEGGIQNTGALCIGHFPIVSQGRRQHRACYFVN